MKIVYTINLHYHKVEGTIVAQKIHIFHEKINIFINSVSIYSSFMNSFIFAMQIKKMNFQFF